MTAGEFQGTACRAQTASEGIAPRLSTGVYRPIRKGNPKFWASDSVLGKYTEWAVRWIGNEKRPSRAGILPNAAIANGKLTFHSQSQKAAQLSAQPQLAVRRAGRFFCDDIRVFSECATIQEFSDFALLSDVSGSDPHATVRSVRKNCRHISGKRLCWSATGTRIPILRSVRKPNHPTAVSRQASRQGNRRRARW